MAIRVALQHRTTYRFDRNVGLGPHEIRLRPAPHCRTPILGYSLNVAPDKYFLNWQQDPYGNWVARLVFTEPADRLDIRVDLTADMTVINPFDFFVEQYAEIAPFTYAPALAKELIPFLETAPAGPRLAAWLERFRPTIRPHEKTVDMLVRLNRQLQREISYLVRMEPGVQPPDTTLERAQGSCRDTGWLLVQILRHLGLAARFASGYLIQLTADVKPLDGPAGPDRDFTDLHAWAEVYLPGAGWIGLDPTSGLLAGEGPHSSGVHRRPGQRGAGDRLHRCVRGRFLVRDAADARARGSAGHQAVLRCAVGGDSRSRPAGGRGSGEARRAPDAGRRADVRVRRRHGRPGVESHGALAEETRAGRDVAAPARHALRAPAAFCTRARANGIRASRFRAGPSASGGARTGSRCGATRR